MKTKTLWKRNKLSFTQLGQIEHKQRALTDYYKNSWWITHFTPRLF